MLYKKRYLFVLDGLEVMQHTTGDRFGQLKNEDFRDFLDYFARPGHQSFCLVTSRAPLLDLERHTTYTPQEVERLSPADGRALLRRLEVKDFPAIVAQDCHGGNIYVEGVKKYARE